MPPTAPQGKAAPDPAHRLRRAWAEGAMEEEQLLDRLALFYDLERADLVRDPPDPALQDLLDPRYCLRHQIAPYRCRNGTLTFVTARPEYFADRLPELAKLVPDYLRISARSVLAPGAVIHRFIEFSHAATLYAAMSTRVEQSESCRQWPSKPRRILQAALLGLLLVAGICYLPRLVFALFVGWAIVTMILAMLMKSCAAIRHLSRPTLTTRAAPPPEDELPVISILAPLFRERRIAEALITRLQRIDYPREKLDVVLCLEEKDTVTRETIAALSLPHWMRVVTVPDGLPKTKPRAMNYCLDFCFGEIIGIYDAEDAPDPDQLRNVVQHFTAATPDVVCVQGALDFYNARENWLARCFTIEYNSWFRMVLPGLAKLGLAIPLGGTTLFMKRHALEEMGGWDAHNVTEDADLGYRIARYGYRSEILESTTMEEANCHAYPWVKQRSRWLKGYMITYMVHLRHPLLVLRQLGLWRFVGFHAHFITAISQFMLAPLLWSFWLMVLGLPHPLLGYVPETALRVCAVLFFTAELQNMALGFLATRAPRHRHLWLSVPSMHFYYPLGCLASYKAFYELIVCPFYWDKTQHGASPQAVAPAVTAEAAAPADTPAQS